MSDQRILILELGGERAPQIAQFVRSFGVDAKVTDTEIMMIDVRDERTAGVIVIGSPDDVNSPSAMRLPAELFEAGKPILCVGYGMYAMTYALMGRVEKYTGKLAPKSKAVFDISSVLFESLKSDNIVENFYKDSVTILPRGFRSIACSKEFPNLAMADDERKIYGIQPFPDNESGHTIIGNYLTKICKCVCDRTPEVLEENIVGKLRAKIRKGNAVVAVSGGVSSLVCVAACMKALSGRCRFVMVDHGLFRKNEIEETKKVIASYGQELEVIDASERTLTEIEGKVAYTEKRNIICGIIYDELKNYVRNNKDTSYIIAGIYKSERITDGDECVRGSSEFKELVTPFDGLYRSEVREIGKYYGFSVSELSRHRFSGAALAGCIADDVTVKKLEIVRMADYILCDEMSKTRCKTKKLMAVLFKPLAQEEHYCIAIRAVTMYGALGPTFVPVPYRVLSKISERITEEIPDITRVAFDISDVFGVNSEYI